MSRQRAPTIIKSFGDSCGTAASAVLTTACVGASRAAGVRGRSSKPFPPGARDRAYAGVFACREIGVHQGPWSVAEPGCGFDGVVRIGPEPLADEDVWLTVRTPTIDDR